MHHRPSALQSAAPPCSSRRTPVRNGRCWLRSRKMRASSWSRCAVESPSCTLRLLSPKKGPRHSRGGRVPSPRRRSLAHSHSTTRRVSLDRRECLRESARRERRALLPSSHERPPHRPNLKARSFQERGHIASVIMNGTCVPKDDLRCEPSRAL